MANGQDSAGQIQAGPWWSRILTNKNAVIALVALYLMYFVTGLFDTRLAQLDAQTARIETNLAEHREADRAHYVRLEDLMVRLNDQAVLQTRLAREVCWAAAKSDSQRRKCLDPDVK